MMTWANRKCDRTKENYGESSGKFTPVSRFGGIMALHAFTVCGDYVTIFIDVFNSAGSACFCIRSKHPRTFDGFEANLLIVRLF
jgi:hypothetical protein